MAPSIAVSVVIPLYRGEKFIGRTLESLLAQSFTEFEVVCVDDHSPDQSAAIVEAMAGQDARIRYFQTRTNLGIVPRVINAVRHKIRGRYFVYSSQDDFFSPDWLEKMVTTIERTGADAVVPNVEFVDAMGLTFRRLSPWDRFGDQLLDGAEAFFLSLDWTVPTNALWRTELLRIHGYFDFGLYADEYTGRFYFLNCRHVAFCNSTFYYVHGNPEAITKKISPGRLDTPYNDYRIWELIHMHAPEADWAKRYARHTVRQLLEALVLVVNHPELASDTGRLQVAIDAMKSPAFKSDLREAFSAIETYRKVAAFALLEAPAVRALAPRLVAAARRVKAAVRLWPSF